MAEAERTDYDDADVRWACARKKAYFDKKFAKSVARRIREEKGADVVSYMCRHCGSYHIGRGRDS